MVDENFDGDDIPELDETVVSDDDSPRGLRDVIAQQAARIKELEQSNTVESEDLSERLMAQAFDTLGLDSERGTGKAIAVTFDGAPEDLAEYAATEFDYFGKNHPMADQIRNAQANLDALGQTAGSIAPPTEADVLAAAEKRGDTGTTMALKSQQLGRLIRP